tara:strand:- start:187 stop:444 length:258 start_codon:yes stop_codon:yes gene_type:complete
MEDNTFYFIKFIEEYRMIVIETEIDDEPEELPIKLTRAKFPKALALKLKLDDTITSAAKTKFLHDSIVKAFTRYRGASAWGDKRK